MAKQESREATLPILKADLKAKNLRRLYFFHGPETFLMNYYLQQMKKLLIDDLTESFNFHKLTEETFRVSQLAEAVENLPMMAEHTFVWVDEIDIFQLDEADRNRVCELFADIPEYCTVVFTYVTTPWKIDGRMKKLSDAVKTYGQEISFDKQEQKDLIPWIARHFAAHNKKIPNNLCVYLIELTGGSMTSLSSEISKLCAYSGAEVITKSDIDTVVEPVLDAVVFQMTDLLGQGNCGGALLKLRQLLQMQEEPLGILGAIGAHFRRLGVARTFHDNGRPASELVKAVGGSEYYARRNMDAAVRFSARFYRVAMERILETDLGIKSSLDNPQRLLELLVMDLYREARNG